MKILVVKTLNGSLKPAYDTDLEVFKKMPKGEPFEIEYKKKRNPLFHRKYFSLMNLAYNNQDTYEHLDDVRRYITVMSGFVDEFVNKDTGEVFLSPKSISFDSMDELEFSGLYEKSKNVISKWIGVSNEEIEIEIMQYY